LLLHNKRMQWSWRKRKISDPTPPWQARREKWAPRETAWGIPCALTDLSSKSGRRANGRETHSYRNSNNRKASKKSAKTSGHGKLKDLKAKMNPRGGTGIPTYNLPPVDLGSTGMSSGGGKTPSVGSITITKTDNSSSSNLFQASSG